MDFVVVKDPVTKTIEVATKGPKGDKGDPGEVTQAALNSEAAARAAADTALQTAVNGKAVSRNSGRRAGLYYVPNGIGIAGGAPVLNVMYLWPFVLDVAWTVDRVGVVATAAAACTERLGLYADQADGTPGPLIHDWGTVDCSTQGLKEISITKTFQPGIYWLAAVMQGSAAASLGRVSLLELGARMAFATTPGVPLPTQMLPWVRTGVTGALPDPAGTVGTDIGNTSTVSTPPNVVFRSA